MTIFIYFFYHLYFLLIFSFLTTFKTAFTEQRYVIWQPYTLTFIYICIYKQLNGINTTLFYIFSIFSATRSFKLSAFLDTLKRSPTLFGLQCIYCFGRVWAEFQTFLLDFCARLINWSTFQYYPTSRSVQKMHFLMRTWVGRCETREFNRSHSATRLFCSP